MSTGQSVLLNPALFLARDARTVVVNDASSAGMERTDVGSDNGAEAQRRGDATAPLSPAPSSVALSAALNVSAAAPACVVDLAKRNLKQLHDLYRGIGEVRRAASRRGARGRRDCALDASQQHELAGKALATIARAQFLRDQRRSREARAEAAELEELVEVMAELNAELLESECIAQFGKHDDLDPDVMELTARIREIRSQKRAVENRRRALQREESDEEDAEQGMEEGAEEEGEEEGVIFGVEGGSLLGDVELARKLAPRRRISIVAIACAFAFCSSTQSRKGTLSPKNSASTASPN